MLLLLSCDEGGSLGQQNIIRVEDCAGVIEGDSEEDSCGVCGGDNSSCSESWPVYFNSFQSIGGFQVGIEEVIILNASGGVASDSGFSVSNGNKTVLGFTFDGSVIYPESGNILTILTISGDIDNACLIDVIIASPSGEELPISVQNCNTIIIP